jgi:diguanylate cyclase (GGDEF)-like protein
LPPAYDAARKTLDLALSGAGPAQIQGSSLAKILATDPQDLEGVIRVVKENPLVTAQILNVANSVASGMSQEVRSIQRAVTMLGARRARSLAMAASLRLFTSNLGLSQSVSNALLENSVQRAMLARRFCEVVDPECADEAYTTALMLDLGLPVLMATDLAPYSALLTRGASTDNLIRDECQHFGVDHGIIGATLLAKWNVAHETQMLVLQHQGVPDHHELFTSGGRSCSVRLATFFAGLLPHAFESSTPFQSAWMRAMHHLFLGAHYESLEMFLATVSSDAREVLGPAPVATLGPSDSRDLAARIVSELLTDTVQLIGNLCQIEQVLNEAQAGSRELKFQAFTDSLTKLLNRQGFFTLSQQRMRAAAGQQPVTCLLCDLDDFKSINDSHGHAIGDQALRGFAKLLRDVCPQKAITGRLGGDEFAIILIGPSPEEAMLVSQGIEKRVRSRALRVSDQLTLQLSASIGVVHVNSPPETLTPQMLLKAADEVMYVRKHDGKGGTLFKHLTMAPPVAPPEASQNAA